MPVESNQSNIADVTILSNMMAETKIHGERYYACNWKEWMNERSDCSPETILAFAEAEAAKSSGVHAKKWQNLVEYSVNL
jgi:hypothetical protein